MTSVTRQGPPMPTPPRMTHNAFLSKVRAQNGIGIAEGFIVRCGCGWELLATFDTTEEAQARIDLHLAVARHRGETIDQPEPVAALRSSGMHRASTYGDRPGQSTAPVGGSGSEGRADAAQVVSVSPIACRGPFAGSDDCAVEVASRETSHADDSSAQHDDLVDRVVERLGVYAVLHRDMCPAVQREFAEQIIAAVRAFSSPQVRQ